ncbi:hypothetical protein J5U18_03625 [Sphingobacteriaceae bacterium WQ 2009]|uniref:Uncharacterized protein n=1 Tax=Rhinopithecimicrobium faecis TaxID=2820698 RepID=A0A8T4H676_9SPHI|nr:hypothetical protein [Sphingobacteriaceae bacterium WQ 2009]
MSLISREEEVQERMLKVIDALKKEIELLRVDLVQCCEQFNEVCNQHIESGYAETEKLTLISDKHQQKFNEFEITNKLLEITADYTDLQGHIPEYQDLITQLENMMLSYAKLEEYEVAAVIKKWLFSMEDATAFTLQY